MPVNAVYQHNSDHVGGLASAITATTEDTDYPAENIATADPTLPSKLTGTSGNWVFDFGAAQRVDIVAIIHHNIDAGLEVRIQGNATDVWTSPTLNEAFTIPAYFGDGYPGCPWLDLTGATGYSTSGFRYWRLVVVGTNSAAVAVGTFWMGSLFRSLDPNIEWGVRIPRERKIIEHSTDYGVVNVYDLGVTVRRLEGNIDSPDSQHTAILAWWRDTKGRSLPFLLVPDGTVNEAWLVRWSGIQVEPTYQFLGRTVFPLSFTEVGRGLVL